MANWIYVDNSNVFIEGQRVSAVRKGMALDIFQAMENNIIDHSYRISFGKLYQFIAGTDRKETARAMLFGSRPPNNDIIWNMARQAGFEVITYDRNIRNKEKKIDTGIVTQMIRDAYKNAEPRDIFTLVSGDSDYVPTIQALVEDGFQVDVVFWSHAAKEIRDVCSNFIPLDEHLDMLMP